MRPLRLELHDFLSHRETVLDLSDSGAIAIVGENGAGKSSLVEAISWCLFAQGRGTGPDSYVRSGATSCRVRFEFELDGRMYAVERQRDRTSGGKSYLTLQALHAFFPGESDEKTGRAWQTVGGDHVAQTQTVIEGLLGMSADVWLSTSYVGQGKADLFTELRPAARKQLLVDLLELDRYAELASQAKDQERTASTRLEELDRRAASLGEVIETEHEVGERLARLRDEADELSKLRAAKLIERDEAQERVARLNARVIELTRVREELDALRARRREDARQVDVDGARLDEELRRAEHAWSDSIEFVGAVTDRASQEADLIDVLREAKAINHDGLSDALLLTGRRESALSSSKETMARLELNASVQAELSERIEGLERHANGTCFTCGQDLPEDVQAALVASLKAQLVEAKGHGADLDSDRQNWLERLSQVDSAITEMRRHNDTNADRLVRVERNLYEAHEAALKLPAEEDKLANAESRVMSARATVEDFATRRLATRQPSEREVELELTLHTADETPSTETTPLHLIEEQITAMDSRIHAIAREEGAAEHTAAAIEESKVELESIQAESTRVAGIREELRVLAEAFGPNGIPTLIIETAVPELESEANRLLQQLTEDRFTLRVESLKALKGGGVRESLEVIVGDDVSERPLEALSGGERQCVDLALRISLARLLAHRAGRNIECLILDEVFTALDLAHRQRTVQVLHGLMAEFRTILFITHLDLGDVFPTQIQVTREDGTSTVRVVEAVTA